MKIIIKPTNIDLNDVLEKYVSDKLGSLNKLLQDFDPDIVQARVEIGKPSKHHKSGPVFYAEINLSLPGKLLRSEATHIDLRYAINQAKDGLERQIEKYKNKVKNKK